MPNVCHRPWILLAQSIVLILVGLLPLGVAHGIFPCVVYCPKCDFFSPFTPINLQMIVKNYAQVFYVLFIKFSFFFSCLCFILGKIIFSSCDNLVKRCHVRTGFVNHRPVTAPQLDCSITRLLKSDLWKLALSFLSFLW